MRGGGGKIEARALPMAADGSEHHSAATNNLAGGEERSWGHDARQGGAVAGGGRVDG